MIISPLIVGKGDCFRCRDAWRRGAGGAIRRGRATVKPTIGMCLVLLTALEAGAQAPPPPAEGTKTVPLRVYVLDALQMNLSLASTRATTLSTQTGVQSASGAFDPTLTFSPTFTNADQTLLAPSQTLTGTQKGTVLGSTLLGTLPITTGYSISFDSNKTEQDNTALLAPGVQTPTVNNSMRFGINQPLLRGFGPTYARAPVNIADYGSRSAQARLDRTSDTTIADVETAYWNLGLAEAIERLSKDSYDRAQELLARNTRML